MQYEDLSAKLPLQEAGKMVLGLESVRQLMGHFDHPENSLPTIHIAGTNGKGSTAKMTATILQAAGYKVGLYTSPSLVDFNERIQINGVNVSDDQLMAQVDRMNQALGPDELYTEFEIFTGLAWLVFQAEKVDFVVLEVGLGGRLDATNIVEKPLVTAITKVALDHQHILGDTLAEIAGEKAGIIKAHVPLILYPQAPEAEAAILAQATTMAAPVTKVDSADISNLGETADGYQAFAYKVENYQLSLMAPYQINNAALALEIITKLEDQGIVIGEQAKKDGLAKTTWPARFERVAQSPDIIIDGSHNMDGITSLTEAIEKYYPSRVGQKRIAILGMLADKDVAHAVETVVPLFDKIITLTPHSHRALPASELAAMLQANGGHASVANSDTEALEMAQACLNDQDMLCIFGSFYFVGYLRKQILQG
ncbi:bifunctional folylpolyglutamate synthase/dihydrofolate synthase [Aerococcus agrisoli]|uniref:tetrahydrofolate synthase n=1 Tax=Aerococcus agrisoli TaxID=2487350 RepID=A0A3N4GCL2_9LACT|nr:folylpolyglutamate synthase/dihydrofolate synthase family protein [Aerococcus agrisoli]RPA60502.1 bifunctional folylpolyglutamate synthase/dihydrofolate synthase [Aerococcus agrisoli]